MRKLQILIFTGLFGVSGCTDGGPAACTEIGCGDSLTVTVTFSDGFSLGDYEIELDYGQVPTDTCSFDYVDSASDCDGSSPCVADATCNATWNVAGASLSFGIAGTPTDVIVTVKHEDADLIARALSPEYESVRPNGEGCEPVCEMASETVLVEGP